MIQFTVFGEPKKSYRAKQIKYCISENGCWDCVSHATDKKGYPVVTREGKFWRMARYVYTLEKGEIPIGKIVMHSCDNTNCINPEHLSIGTVRENIADMVKKKRHAIGERNGGGVKLNSEKVKMIRKDQRPLRVIAADYNVSHKLILLVKRKKIWGHVV